MAGRQSVNSGPSVDVQLKAGTRYRLQAYVKQLNDAGGSDMFQEHMLKITYHFAGHSKDLHVHSTECLVCLAYVTLWNYAWCSG